MLELFNDQLKFMAVVCLCMSDRGLVSTSFIRRLCTGMMVPNLAILVRQSLQETAPTEVLTSCLLTKKLPLKKMIVFTFLYVYGLNERDAACQLLSLTGVGTCISFTLDKSRPAVPVFMLT